MGIAGLNASLAPFRWAHDLLPDVFDSWPTCRKDTRMENVPSFLVAFVFGKDVVLLFGFLGEAGRLDNAGRKRE